MLVHKEMWCDTTLFPMTNIQLTHLIFREATGPSETEKKKKLAQIHVLVGTIHRLTQPQPDSLDKLQNSDRNSNPMPLEF